MSVVRRLVLAAAALGLVPALALLPLPAAGAATLTIVVNTTTFKPSDVTIVLKTGVQYRNNTGTAIVVQSATTNWAFNELLAPGQTSSVHTPAVVGTYRASASGPGVAPPNGTIHVVKSLPSPTPSKTGGPKPTSTRSSPPTSHPPRTSSPHATANPSTGTASVPPIGPGFTPPPSPSANPTPAVAPPPTDPPALAGRSQKTLVQPHLVRRLGLPGALSFVLLLGLLFGILRVLLAVAPAPPARERTD